MSQRMPPPIDLETLLQPIAPELPAGEWLRYEGTYDRIQDARREDDPTLPQGIWRTAQKRANWPEVARLCQQALRERSKDLQIAAWLLEAWLHLHGHGGLTQGLRLLRALCERFWDDIYPMLDPEDASYRLAPIEWIDQKLPLQLKLLPLTRPVGEGVRSFSYGDWELALHRQQLGEREESDGITTARILHSAELTPRALLLSDAAALAEAQQEAGALAALLDELTGQETASLRQLRKTLGDVHRLLNQLTGQGSDAAPDAAPGSPVPGEEPMSVEVEERGHGGPIRSRAEAYRRLEEAAEYLLRTEPHSPTPYLVKRAVSWGNKSLGELLAEIVGSEQHLRAIYQLLAIRGGE